MDSHKVVGSYLSLGINHNDTSCSGFSQSLHIFVPYCKLSYDNILSRIIHAQ